MVISSSRLSSRISLATLGAGGGGDSVVEFLTSVPEVLGSVPRTARKEGDKEMSLRHSRMGATVYVGLPLISPNQRCFALLVSRTAQQPDSQGSTSRSQKHS